MKKVCPVCGIHFECTGLKNMICSNRKNDCICDVCWIETYIRAQGSGRPIDVDYYDVNQIIDHIRKESSKHCNSSIVKESNEQIVKRLIARRL